MSEAESHTGEALPSEHFHLAEEYRNMGETEAKVELQERRNWLASTMRRNCSPIPTHRRKTASPPMSTNSTSGSSIQTSLRHKSKSATRSSSQRVSGEPSIP